MPEDLKVMHLLLEANKVSLLLIGTRTRVSIQCSSPLPIIFAKTFAMSFELAARARYSALFGITVFGISREKGGLGYESNQVRSSR